MKRTTLVVILLLLAGTGAGYMLGRPGGESTRSTPRAPEILRIQELLRAGSDQADRIAKLIEENEKLRSRLAERPPETQEGPADPYPDDSVDAVERLLEDAYAENNIDWLLEVIERLLRMGEKGYPTLRRMLEDIFFRARFLPSESDFRWDQIYRVGRIFANLEPQFIGFLNFLLKDPRAHPWFKQAAMMGGAFYVGSNAKGAEELKQTMLQIFLQDAGGGVFGMPGMPPQVAKRMSIYAMAMSGDKRMIAPLHAELNKSKDKGEQSDIIGALAYLGDPKVVPLVQERLDPREGDFRKEIKALARIGTDEANATATHFLQSIPDSKRFYRHARDYVRSGGGTAGVYLIRDRFQADPKDPAVGSAIGTLRRYPTKESLETLQSIAAQSPDENVKKRAAEAAGEVARRLRGEIPGLPEGAR